VEVKLVGFGHIHAGYGWEGGVTFDHVGNAFEDIVFGEKGVWSLMKMAFCLLAVRSFGSWMGSRMEGTEPANVAAVGGRHKEEIREPIVGHI